MQGGEQLNIILCNTLLCRNVEELINVEGEEAVITNRKIEGGNDLLKTWMFVRLSVRRHS